MTELRECPFCGAEASETYSEYLDMFVVDVQHNPVCALFEFEFETMERQTLISKWNTRTNDWQPIDTAKEDKRYLLRYYKGNPPDPLRTIAINDFFVVEGYLWDDCWYDYAGRVLQKVSSKNSKNRVTHYKPLPTPPQETE